MKKLSILICTMLALTGFMATTARAQSPHFVGTPTFSFDTSTGNLCVHFKEAGLGNFSTIQYTLSADTATFTFQCFTRSSNEPQGEPNSTSLSPAVATVRLPVGRNGQITGDVCLGPCAAGSCQGRGLVLKLIAASYTGTIQLCDELGNCVTASQDTFGGNVQPPVNASTLPTCPTP
jgi:hypothetical protein